MNFGIIYNNGWVNGDWHLVYFDIFHEEPPPYTNHLAGISIGLFGFIVGLGIEWKSKQ